MVRFSGEDREATGKGWHDRQWDNVKRSNELAFTWFGICLDSGDTLSFFDTGADGNGHNWVTIARADGTHIVTAAVAHGDEAMTTEAGRKLPCRWLLEVPASDGAITIEHRLLSDSAALYTGVLEIKGIWEGTDIMGFGFCDVVGRIDQS